MSSIASASVLKKPSTSNNNEETVAVVSEKKERVWHELPSLFPGGPSIVYFSPTSSDKLSYEEEKTRNPNMPDLIRKSVSNKDSKDDNNTAKQQPIIYYRIHDSAVEFSVILNSLKKTGMKKTTTSKWNVMWGKHLPFDEYEKISKFQKFNHFPGTWELGRKDNLHRNLTKMRRKFPQDYNFFPESFLYPEEKDTIKNEFEKNEHLFGFAGGNASNKKPPPIFIVKPRASSCGRGIKLINSYSQLNPKKQYLVQRYIANPLLIDGKKWDLRIYVVATSFDPLRIYLFPDGLVRFATVKYADPNTQKKKLKNRFCHLTNFSVNKKNKAFIKNQKPEDDDFGSKWSHVALRRYFKEQGIDDTEMWLRIRDLLIKTFIGVESAINGYFQLHVQKNPTVSETHPLNHPNEPSRMNCCYELFGFDVMIDENMKPWLLEVNISPSLASSSPLDKKIKTEVITDMFNLAGVCAVPALSDAQRKDPGHQDEIKMEKLNVLTKAHVSKKEKPPTRNLIDLKEMDELNDLCFNERIIIQETEDELVRKGQFERIFPAEETLFDDPVAETQKYFRYFEAERYRNCLVLLWQRQKKKFLTSKGKKTSISESSTLSGYRSSSGNNKPYLPADNDNNSSLPSPTTSVSISTSEDQENNVNPNAQTGKSRSRSSSAKNVISNHRILQVKSVSQTRRFENVDNLNNSTSSTSSEDDEDTQSAASGYPSFPIGASAASTNMIKISSLQRIKAGLPSLGKAGSSAANSSRSSCSSFGTLLKGSKIVPRPPPNSSKRNIGEGAKPVRPSFAAPSLTGNETGFVKTGSVLKYIKY